ncbi:MAG: DUF2339 domain-containing protein [Bacteroidota bacterium]
MIFFVVIVIFAFVIVAIRISALSSKIENLEYEFKKFAGLQKAITALEQEVQSLARGVGRGRKPEAPQPEPPKEQSVSVFAPPQEVQIPRIPLSARPVEKPSRTKEEWEALVGGKILNRIGALAFIIGIGFFLKYAFDNNWITEAMRVVIGALAGFLCIALAYRSHKKGFEIFSQGLVGAGIAILYLSVYAAFNFYQLVPQFAAFLMMSAVTMIALANGLFYDSLAVALLGLAGGFLTPLMLSTGDVNETGLFTYIALLDVGLLAIVAKKDSWYLIEPLTFAATWLFYFSWHVAYSTENNLAITLFFVTVFWALFYGLEFLHADKPASGMSFVIQIVPGLNAMAYYLSLYLLIDPEHHSWMAGVTIFLGAVYFATILGLSGRKTISMFVRIRYTLSALTLLVLATAIQFSGFRTVSLWLLEAGILLWCSIRWNMRFVSYAALALFTIAFLKLLGTSGTFVSTTPEDFSLVLNERFLTFVVAIATFAVSAFMARRGDAYLLPFATVFEFAWCTLAFLLITVETNDYFNKRMLFEQGDFLTDLQFTEAMTLSVLWTVLSLLLGWAGGRGKLLPLLTSATAACALAASFVVVRGIAFEPITHFTPVLNTRVAALLFVSAGIAVHTWWMKDLHDPFPWTRDLLPVFQVGLVLLVFVLLTGETRDYFQRGIVPLQRDSNNPEGLSSLRNLQQICLSGVWLLYSAALMTVGLWRSQRGMRLASIFLFGFTIIKIFTFDLSFLETLYRIYSFLGLGIILLGVSYAYQRYKNVILGTQSKL